jgi:hypothetical protein
VPGDAVKWATITAAVRLAGMILNGSVQLSTLVVHRTQFAQMEGADMRYRILTIGIDVRLLTTRQALLISCGYNSLLATPEEVEEKLQSGPFDLVILSAMLSQEEKRRIQAKLPHGTRPLVLETLVMPKELLRMVAEALR